MTLMFAHSLAQRLAGEALEGTALLSSGCLVVVADVLQSQGRKVTYVRTSLQCRYASLHRLHPRRSSSSITLYSTKSCRTALYFTHIPSQYADMSACMQQHTLCPPHLHVELHAVLLEGPLSLAHFSNSHIILHNNDHFLHISTAVQQYTLCRPHAPPCSIPRRPS